MHPFIKKLLNGQKVEWKTLGESLVRTKGTPITAGQMKELHKENAPVKIFAGGKTFALVNFEDIPQKDIHTKPSIIVKSRGIIEFEYYDKPFSHKNEMWSYHSNNKDIEIKFIYYFLKTQEKHFQQIGSRMQMPQIATPDTDKFLIPIPPLHVQTMIVKYLDTMTSLTAELTAELTLREKQYNYYREKLLSFENQEGGAIDWLPLGDIAKIKNGKDWKGLHSGEIPVYGSGGIMTYVDKASYTSPSVLIPRKGSISNIFYTDKPFWNVDTIFYTEINTNRITPKFFYYFMKNFNLSQLATDSTRPSLTQTVLNKIVIPIPPLAEQQRIVDILDKFETLTTSIKEGLPLLIQQSQQRYKYYREQLLTFN